MAERIGHDGAVNQALSEVRERRPLVHCLTAAVSMGFVADALLAAGARAMMTETAQEAPVVVAAADALLVNLGTLSTDAMEGIPATVRAAIERGLPWVLDPTAIGLPPVRTRLARELVALGPAVVRANASEVLVLAGEGVGGSGPDSIDPVADAGAAARRLADEYGCVVAVSGPRDLVVAPDRGAVILTGGDPLLTRVTGTGCVLGALTAACCAATEPYAAARAATGWLNLAAEDAAGRAGGPGTFKVELLDALARVTGARVAERALVR